VPVFWKTWLPCLRRSSGSPPRTLIENVTKKHSANVIYCITCTYCKKIGETGRWLGDQFQEHLCDVERNDKNASKPVARHFNLPNHSKQHTAICGLSLHLGSSESRKSLEQKFIFQIGTLNPIGINSLRWPIYIFNLVDITKLPCYAYRHSTTVSLETFTLDIHVIYTVNHWISTPLLKHSIPSRPNFLD